MRLGRHAKRVAEKLDESGFGALKPWQEWQGSAFARVRLRSLALREDLQTRRFERTGANGSERSPAFAMQKVVGSSPIIRS